jgi:hypothetical protein
MHHNPPKDRSFQPSTVDRNPTWPQNAFVPLAEVSREVASWVTQVAVLTTPDQIHWCDGSPAETARLRNDVRPRRST